MNDTTPPPLPEWRPLTENELPQVGDYARMDGGDWELIQIPSMWIVGGKRASWVQFRRPVTPPPAPPAPESCLRWNYPYLDGDTLRIHSVANGHLFAWLDGPRAPASQMLHCIICGGLHHELALAPACQEPRATRRDLIRRAMALLAEADALEMAELQEEPASKPWTLENSECNCGKRHLWPGPEHNEKCPEFVPF